ncbi:MAG TPA: hypothetical protein VND22_07725, partial [Actinomycetota bacterium]|nr:hypothetical protein [Actinomycetota bacterium]
GSYLRSPRAAVLVFVLSLAAANLAVTFNRSLIPQSIDGRVDQVERRFEKHVGLDDVFLLTVGGRTTQIDATLAGAVEQGDRVKKRAFSRTLTTPDGDITLSPSREFWRMAVAMPVLFGLALFLALHRNRS